jgi:hypothetical protein
VLLLFMSPTLPLIRLACGIKPFVKFLKTDLVFSSGLLSVSVSHPFLVAAALPGALLSVAADPVGCCPRFPSLPGVSSLRPGALFFWVGCLFCAFVVVVCCFGGAQGLGGD